MKTLLLMAAVLLTACGGPLTETDEANADVGQTTAALKDSEPAPSAYQMCMMVCLGLPSSHRYLCELDCFIATRGGLPDKKQ